MQKLLLWPEGMDKPGIQESVKGRIGVMPDLIRHPEHIEMTGFRPSPE
jgi:hypothetical protein